MQDAIIYIDPDKPVSLQNQIRQKLVDGIINGVFPPGMKLPSSRKLAQQLDVARNTVVAAYQQLVADGYLVSKQRSGIFVNEEMLEARIGHSGNGSLAAQAESAAWARRVTSSPGRWREVHDQPNWRHYPYPFIDGKFDSTLFPLAGLPRNSLEATRSSTSSMSWNATPRSQAQALTASVIVVSASEAMAPSRAAVRMRLAVLSSITL